MTKRIRSYVSSIEGRWGRTYFIKDDEYVGKSLKNYGEYNPDETEFLLNLAYSYGGTVLDIGANIGVMSQALAREGFDVIAFEPQKAVFDILKLNCPMIPCYNVALGATNGKTNMPKVEYHKHGNFGGISCGSGEIEVELRTLDSFKFTNIGVIKLDVEGFEEQVLRGAMGTIRDSLPVIYLEADRADKIASLKAFIQSIEYSWEPHQPLLYREKNFFDKKVNVWAPMNYASHNVLCRPIL